MSDFIGDRTRPFDRLRAEWIGVSAGEGAAPLTFAMAGARVTFLDIAESNLALVRRRCEYQHVEGVDCFLTADRSFTSRSNRRGKRPRVAKVFERGRWLDRVGLSGGTVGARRPSLV